MLTVVVTGTTGSGKGAVAYELARLLGGEIISLDSMKVYRGMDIGTAKPDSRRRGAIPHHLLDVVEPSEEFSLGRYVREALRTCGEIHGRGNAAVFVGGTPLYLRALVKGFCPAPEGDPVLRRKLKERSERNGLSALYGELQEVDPESAAQVHPNDRRRIMRSLEVYYLTGTPFTELWKHSVIKLPPASYRIFGITWPRELLYRRINERVDRMALSGLFREAAHVSTSFPSLSPTVLQCIGYKEIWQGEREKWGREEIVELIKRNTRRFSRKQMTWFRHFPEIEWISPLHASPHQIARRLAGMLGPDRLLEPEQAENGHKT